MKLKSDAVLTLMGPTASGKTALGIALAEQFPAEIISVDSALVYSQMDIGTAKPSMQERGVVIHHLIDIRDPKETYSVKEFLEDASGLIEDILHRGKTPILVGGTMLYFKALFEGLTDMPSKDMSVRADIEQAALEKGWPYIHTQLAKVDPDSAARLHPNHSQRLMRALEVYRLSGKTMTYWHQQKKENLADKYHWVQLAVMPRQRALLHERIALRFQQIVALGFEAEVRSLMARGDLNKSLPSMRSVGYRQMWDYLEGQGTFDDMVEKGIAATRQLAKRQITWLRSWQDLSWVYTQKENGEILTSCEILFLTLNNLRKIVI